MADAAPIFERYAQDPAVTRFLTWRPHQQVADTETYVAQCLAAADSRTYVITMRRSREIVGAFDLRGGHAGRLGFGYVVARACWGQGVATEALTAVANWALRQPGIWRVGDVCDVGNIASARVMEKAGLVREGVLRRWAVHPNISVEPRDCISYAKVK